MRKETFTGTKLELRKYLVREKKNGNIPKYIAVQTGAEEYLIVVITENQSRSVLFTSSIVS